ncbi:hypothetical protein AB833_22190 [Chromatiales bacterium (ex Bugula neritina AB1)]|nr:hypothetical protein AB833_22190 [Chromatiales bacterium (ex Bugula neritina AB1)]
MPDTTTPVFLSDAELQSLDISNLEVIEAIEQAVSGVKNGEISVAPKTVTRARDGRYMMATLSASDDSGLIVVKSVIANDRNKARGLPGVNGGIMLLDSETGALKATLDANWVTAVRTAGLSALASKRLANPQSATLALIGTGVQAQSHLRALVELFPINSVMVAGRGSKGIERIAAVAAELGLAFRQAAPEQCLRESDIVVSSVSLHSVSRPFLSAQWVKSGSFAIIIDQGGPWVKSTYQAFGQIYIDDKTQEEVMKEPLVDLNQVAGDLTDLLNDEIKYNSKQSSAFIFRGVAVGDLAVAALAYNRAVEERARQLSIN